MAAAEEEVVRGLPQHAALPPQKHDPVKILSIPGGVSSAVGLECDHPHIETNGMTDALDLIVTKSSPDPSGFPPSLRLVL